MTTDDAKKALKELGGFLTGKSDYVNPHLYREVISIGALRCAAAYVINKPYGYDIRGVQRVRVWDNEDGILEMGPWIVDLARYAQKLKQATDDEHAAEAAADKAVLQAYMSNTGNT